MVQVVLEVGVGVRVTVRHVVGVVDIRELLQVTQVHNSFSHIFYQFNFGDILLTYLYIELLARLLQGDFLYT